MFVHDALKELIMCGETEIPAPDLESIINKLSETNDGTTEFDKQFQVYIACWLVILMSWMQYSVKNVL